MADNEFKIELAGELDKAKTKAQVTVDAQNLGDIPVKLVGELDMSKTNAKIQQQMNGVTITPTVNTQGVQTATKQALNNAQKVANNNKVSINFDTNKEQLVNQIKILGKQNDKLFNNKEMTDKYNKLLSSANIAKSSDELKNLRSELSAFKTELVATDNAGMKWTSKFKETVSRYGKFFSGASFVYTLSNKLREAWTEAKELDKSYTDLIKVQSELTRGDYPEYLAECNKKAQDLATTQQSLIDGATEFSKSGYSKSESDKLAEKAVILSNVGDMSASDSAKAIISGVQAYDVVDGYDNVIDKAGALIDKYNEIGNTASITSAEIAQGVQTVGSVFADANTSVDQFIALLSAGNRQFQDADTLSLGLRTAALRIRGCKAELSQLGETTEGVYTSSSKLADKIAGLTNIDGKGGVQILEEDGKTFRSIYDIFVDISKVYQQMSDTDQSALLDLIAGKNRASAISATLNNMTEAQEIYERSLNSTGSAQREYDTYLESSEAALNRFRSNMTETYQSVVNGNTVRDLANMGSAVLSFANSFGIAEGTLRGVVAIGIGKFITTGTMAFLSATKQVEQYGKALKMVKDIPNTSFTARNQALNSIAQATSNLTTAQLKNVLSSKTLTQQERVRILQMQGMSKEMAAQKLSEMGLTQATNAQTAANTAQTASTFSLKAALTGLGATIKSVFLSNPLGITLMGISLAVSAVSSSISKHKQELEEQKQKTQEAADEANTYSDELSELSNKYMQLSNAVKTDSSAKEELMSTQTELLKKLGLEGESIDTLIDKYGSLDEAINQASIDSLKKSQIDLLAGVDTARETLLETAKDNFTGSNNIISASGNDAVKAFKELEKAGVINGGSFGEGGGTFILTGDDSVDGALENYRKLEEALNALRDSGEFTAEELSNNPLYSELYNRYNELSDVVEDYNTSIENLNKNLAQQTMLTSLQGKEVPKTKAGFEAFKKELVASAIASKQFIGNEKEIESAINSYLSTVPEFKDFYSLEDGLQEAENSAKEYADAIETVAESTQKVISNISSIDSILSSQKSGQSISIEDFNSDDLKDYQSALEYVNGTMQLNAEKCRDIAKAKAEEQISINNTNKALKQSEYLKNAGEIEKLRKNLSTLTKGTDEYNDTETKLQSLLSSNEAISMECAQYDLLTTALKEATGAYNNWINAQNGSDYGDMFDSSLDAFNRIMDTYNSEKDSYGDFGSKKFDAAVEFIVPNTVDADDINAIQSYMNSFKQYLTFDSDGNTTGMNIEQFCKNAVDKGLMVLDEAGENYEIAGQTTMEDFANGLNLSLPMVQAFFDEMQLKGGEFDWADEAITTVGDLGVKAYESAEALRSLKGDSDLQIQMDVSEIEGLDNKLSTLDNTIKEINDLKASPDVDTAQIDYANDIIQYCVAQKQKLNEPVFMTINADQVEGDLGTVLGLIQQLQSAKNEYDIQASVGADTTEADRKIGELVSQIQDQGAVIKATIGDVDTTNVDTILAGVSAKSAEMWINLGVNETAINDYVPEDKTATVTYEVNSFAVDMYDPKDLRRTVTYTVVTNGEAPKINGITHVNGTVRDNPRIGKALASGDWRTQKDETALVGELGTELVVYGNKYWTVGDTGAEFTHIPKGAIVFNHKQTEEILKNGYVTSDGGRGHAYLNGTAYVKGGISASWANKVSSTSKSSSSSKSSSKSSSSSSSSSSSDTSSDAYEETLDEIEIKIKRIERDITNLDSTVQATYKSWSERNKALISEMSNVRSEIEIQQQAYNRYMQEAESVGLSSDWAAKIREGRIEIEKITDEDLKKKIDLYQQWYEKALDCSDAIIKLKDNLADLAKQRFDNVKTAYDNLLSGLEHRQKMIEGSVKKIQTEAYLVSSQMYEALAKSQRENIAILEKQYAELNATLTTSMAEGKIERYSEMWYTLTGNIQDVESQIQDMNTSLIETQNNIRQTQWDLFDKMQELLSDITTEKEFLVDLMSNDKMYDTETGAITDQGQATLGLYAVAYNTYMNQVNDYAEQIKKINEEIANDPNNQTLLDRKKKLIESQRELIKNANQEKQNIKDLVGQGYDTLLDVMDKLIEKRKNALSVTKDLYTYEKNIRDITDEISSLEKQLKAYQGDDSEFAKNMIQKIQVQLKDSRENLQETEYDKYIEDTEKILSDLRDESEEIFNARLDDLDGLVQGVIDSTNENAEKIKDTLISETKEVGTTISEDMNAIWSTNGTYTSVVTSYSEEFKNKLTTTNTILEAIRKYLAAMSGESDELAKSELDSISGNESNIGNTGGTTPTPSTNTSTNNSSGSGDGVPSVGDAVTFENGRYYYSSDGISPSGSKHLGGTVYITKVNTKSWATKPYHISTGSTLGNGDLGWVSLDQLKGYKTGGLVNETGLAMLHGTPQHPELVLNAHDTENLLDATNLAKMINDGVIKTNQIPIPDFSDSPIFKKLQETMEVNNIKNDYNIKIDKFVDTIEMNGVNDPDEFEKQLEDKLVNSRSVQKIIQEETIGRMLGHNEMKKHFYVHH